MADQRSTSVQNEEMTSHTSNVAVMLTGRRKQSKKFVIPVRLAQLTRVTTHVSNTVDGVHQLTNVQIVYCV